MFQQKSWYKKHFGLQKKILVRNFFLIQIHFFLILVQNKILVKKLFVKRKNFGKKKMLVQKTILVQKIQSLTQAEHFKTESCLILGKLVPSLSIIRQLNTLLFKKFEGLLGHILQWIFVYVIPRGPPWIG